MKPNKALKMLGFVPQPNRHWSYLLGKNYAVIEPEAIATEILPSIIGICHT
ncbi:MAG: hypothetical protein RM347_020370 [Nostoc sp. ChiQUE02]|uniref:hypothetical protein n=1 Tax=Nostoc sp. ChiQUE02 TaxID=3075377 RepID=UPI002AD2B8A0|nr:hypothetical protein [Nostoc sp. ChiQUE02]MDZ8229875.1 hypothetical protein [Nostoc sp. ChiQUE02]